MPPIKGQHLLVIGGSSGIGFAVAKLAAAEGLAVSIAASVPARVSAAVADIQASVPGASVAGYVCDVNHDDAESNLEQLLADVKGAAGGRALDHIVYTAAKLDVRPVGEVSAGYLRDSVQFAYVVPMLIGKLAPRYVNRAYTSSLTLTSGRLGERPLPGMAVPSGWGASIFGTMRGLALDLAPIRVNLVSPGVTDTRLTNEWRDQLVAMAKASLLGKIGTPEEVAEAYIYLMKDTNATGSAVSTNGGAMVQ
ncbi:putative short chain dehydrogenase/ reductase [Hypomontagnella submonticulosa]|nr:putative short chain dehydrogenase/ reductase [Hypomontagnella submonticulosa]